MKIALIKERKQPADSRVALTPVQCKQFMAAYPEVEIYVESSQDRCYTDEEYLTCGVQVVADISFCEVLLGIKEVPESALIAGKTYMFFSHTIKLQPHNQAMFRGIVNKEITLIDYECLSRPQGGRMLGFGYWAGIVGTYNAFLAWGKKTGQYALTPAWQCRDYEALQKELVKIKTDKLAIALTGEGRVAEGSLALLRLIGAQQLSPDAYKQGQDNGIYFVHLNNARLYAHKEGVAFNKAHFYQNHSAYSCVFESFIPHTDMLINGMYWEADMEALFKKEATSKHDFTIQVIADISCDIEGSVPITVKDTTIKDPVFGWHKVNQQIGAPYADDTITVMAVSNLPAELPRNASEAFGEVLSRDVLPLLVRPDENHILHEATLTHKGLLNNKYKYMKYYAQH